MLSIKRLSVGDGGCCMAKLRQRAEPYGHEAENIVVQVAYRFPQKDKLLRLGIPLLISPRSPAHIGGNIVGGNACTIPVADRNGMGNSRRVHEDW